MKIKYLVLIIIMRFLIQAPENVSAQSVLNEIVKSDSSYSLGGSSVLVGNYVYYVTTARYKSQLGAGPEELTLFKVNLSGAIVSSVKMTFLEDVLSSNIELKKTPDNKLVIIYNKEIGNNFRSHVRKVDLNGNFIWETFATLPVGIVSESLGDACVHSDGSIFVSGIAFGNGSMFAYVWRVLSNGTNNYFRTFGGTGGSYYGNTIASSGGNVYLGFVDNTDVNPQGSYYQYGYIVKIDPLNGDSLSSVYLGPGSGLIDMEFISTNKLTLLTYNQSASTSYITTTDLLGNTDSIAFNNVSLTGLTKQSNGLLVYGLNFAGYQRLLISLNTSGQMLWTQNYPSSANSLSTSVSIFTNGKIILFGIRTGSLDSDLLVTKLNKQPCTVPVAQITPSPASYCWNSPAVLSSVDITLGNLYEWRRYGSVQPGTESTFSTSKSGNYKLVVTSSTWCTATSLSTAVTNETPSGLVSGQTTFCPGGSTTLSVVSGVGYSYQWYKYSNLLSGETNPSIVITTAGLYKCIISTASGCSRVSNKVTVTVACLESVNEGENMSALRINETEEAFKFYPNPATDNIVIENIKVGDAIVVLDAIGRTVVNQTAGAIEEVIDISQLKPGYYFIMVGQNKPQQFIKQ